MYHQCQMRRALSISLILFFGLGPLAATLGASDDASLPACCRLLGAHHCAMSPRMAALMAETASGKSALTAPATCPLFPSYTAATAPVPQALAASPVNLPILLAQPHSTAAGHAAARISQTRTRAGRAPPAGLLS